MSAIRDLCRAACDYFLSDSLENWWKTMGHGRSDFTNAGKKQQGIALLTFHTIHAMEYM